MAVRSKTFNDPGATAGDSEITPAKFEVGPARFEIAPTKFYEFDGSTPVLHGGGFGYSADELVYGVPGASSPASDVAARVRALTSVAPLGAGLTISSGELGKVPWGPWSIPMAGQVVPERVTTSFDLSGDDSGSPALAIAPGGFAAVSPTELLHRLGMPSTTFDPSLPSGGRLQGAKAQLDTSFQVLELWRNRVTDGETLLRALQAELQGVVTSLNHCRNTGRLPLSTTLPELLARQASLDRAVESAEEALAQAKSSLADARAAYDAARSAYEGLLRGHMR